MSTENTQQLQTPDEAPSGRAGSGPLLASCSETITLPLADVKALVKLAWYQTRYIEATDRSATGSIYGIEYADKTIAKVAVNLTMEQQDKWHSCAEKLPEQGARVLVENVAGGVQLAVWWGFSRGWTQAGLAYALESKPVRWHLIPARNG